MDVKTIQSLSGREIELKVEDRMYIDGEFVDSEDMFESRSPSTDDLLAHVPIASHSQVDAAVEAASRASETWNDYSWKERRNRLEVLADELEKAREDLINLDVADNGSSIGRMKEDAGKGIDALRYFAGLGSEIKGETIPTGSDKLDFTLREPYGVVGIIIPFNHPGMFVLKRMAPALMAGNGVVLKPGEQTPLSALLIGRLIDEADVFPDGLVNIVTGAAETGDDIVSHPRVRLVTMIGSAATGKAIMRSAAEDLSAVILELGGKNPNIIFPDADLDEAIQGAVEGIALPWQGQSCGSGSRLVVHEDVYDEVVSAVTREFEAVHPGDPFDEDTGMGSIVSEEQFHRVIDYIETGKSEGATLLTGGEVVEDFETGYFVEPTLFEGEPDMTICQEEIFGPVLSVIEWSGYDEMIEIANGVDYGLTAALWTNDLRTAHQTIDDLEAGFVWVNQHGGHFTGAPFGGYKESGIGKKGNLQDLLDHTQVKNVNIQVSGDRKFDRS